MTQWDKTKEQKNNNISRAGLHTIIMKKSFKSALLSLDVSAQFNEIQLILCYELYFIVYLIYLSNWNVHGTNDVTSLSVCIQNNLIL